MHAYVLTYVLTSLGSCAGASVGHAARRPHCAVPARPGLGDVDGQGGLPRDGRLAGRRRPLGHQRRRPGPRRSACSRRGRRRCGAARAVPMRHAGCSASAVPRARVARHGRALPAGLAPAGKRRRERCVRGAVASGAAERGVCGYCFFIEGPWPGDDWCGFQTWHT